MSVRTVLVYMELATTPTVATPVSVNKGGLVNTVMWVRSTSKLLIVKYFSYFSVTPARLLFLIECKKDYL